MTHPKKCYHFIGIGGVGMGALASLMASKGHRVSGSDLKESDWTHKLRQQGIGISIGHSEKNLESPDVVVYSSAISKDNPEWMGARQKGIAILPRAQLLAEIMQSQKGITVAGAHGKTTTTSLISYLLIQAGLHPTTAVGGVVNNGSGYHAHLGAGEYFVAEVDESDGSFLYFSPFYSVITNIDFEHVDYYGSWENIVKAYRQFIARTHVDGHIIGCRDDQKLYSLLKESGRRVTSYGFSKESDVFAVNPVVQGYSTQYECIFRGKNLGMVRLKIPGQHNILNSLACLALGMELGIDLDVIKKSLSEFEGAKRRMQLKWHAHGIMIVDDYGHHPTEITATLKAAKSFGCQRVIVVFQPHRYTRTKYLMDEFVHSLSGCDYLILTDIYAASEPAMEGVNSEALFEKIKSQSRTPGVYLKKEEILAHLLDIVKEGDLVLTLGAGDVTKISDELAARFKGAHEKSAV